jgi:hypothetical protein
MPSKSRSWTMTSGAKGFDLVDVQARQRGGDLVALLLEELLDQVEDLLGVVDDEDMGLTSRQQS